jgi:hypothetical protein
MPRAVSRRAALSALILLGTRHRHVAGPGVPPLGRAPGPAYPAGLIATYDASA